MPRGATCSLTSKAITIVGGSTQRSAISPQSRQTAKPHNLVSTFPGEDQFGVILADGERLYDPGAYHDRLLLGLSGIMSEAELHQIRLRLHQGERQKAARGELRVPLPAGLAGARGGAIVRSPDEEVQARLQLVFTKFTELGSARGVMRHFQEANFLVPV